MNRTKKAARKTPETPLKQPDGAPPGEPAEEVLGRLRREWAREVPAAARRSTIVIGLQACIFVGVCVYGVWLYGKASLLDAEALTAIAEDKVEAILPALREEIRDYAIEVAPEVTERGKEMLLEMPHLIGIRVEERLVAGTDKLIRKFQEDLDGSLTDILETQIALVKSEYPDATAQEAADRTIDGVSRQYREEMMEAVDAMYEEYAREIGKIDRYLRHLQTSEHLTETEKIDKEMIEAWVVLVQRRSVRRPDLVREY